MTRLTRHLPYDRSDRVADGIYKLVAEAVVNDLSDPRLLGVTITRVTMTRDLRTARIYYHQAGEPDAETQDRAGKGLASASSFLRRRIGDVFKLKFTPELRFFYDETMDIEERIEVLLAGIKEDGRHE